jgi:ADP-ribose pyrophosphatase YjhB (NUDIX family)
MNANRKNKLLPPVDRRVGVAAFDGEERILLIKRGNSPALGLWTIPMGKVEKGETLRQAAEREVLEEANVKVKLSGELGTFYANGVELTVFLGYIVGGSLRAGDDAVDAQMICLNKLATLEKTHHQQRDEWAYQMNDQVFAQLTRTLNELGKVTDAN